MSDQFPSHAQVLAQHQRNCEYWQKGEWRVWCSCEEGKPLSEPIEVISDETYIAHVQRRWREACTVTTVEQLDELPVGTVLREDYDGTIWTLHDDGKHIEAYRECDYLPLLTSAISLPARVIHHPNWEAGK